MHDALARNTDPSTSHAAAQAVDADSISGKVLEALRTAARAGLTSEELAERLGMSRVTVSPRLRPLCERGLACDSGERRGGLSGHKSIVWIAAEFADLLSFSGRQAEKRRRDQAGTCACCIQREAGLREVVRQMRNYAQGLEWAARIEAILEARS